MGKIKECQFIIPVPNQSYTDIRPTITGEDWDDIRTTALKLAYGVGNKKLGDVLSGEEKCTAEPSNGLIREIGDGVLFNETDHTYSKNGRPYLSGSTFAHMFEKEFPKETIAKKVAERDEKEVDDVLAGWDAKGQISLDYGTLIHKCIETYCKYGELPNNEYLKSIVEDWAEVFADNSIDSNELFVQDDAHQMCGVIDAIGGDTIYDWKSNTDLSKKVQLTAKDLPNDYLGLYTLQLNFYRYIVEQNGGKVNKLVIGWLNGEHWEKVKVDIIDIRPYLEQVWKPKK